MANIIKLLFTAILLLSQIKTFAAEPLKSSEIEEIKKFTSLSSGKGHLLTPPRGSVQPKMILTRKYINSIIEQLAGSELKKKDVHYVINIYGSDSMNAWVQQFNPTVEKGPEAKWKTDHPNEIWPLRQAWGFPDDQKPIYELGVTSKLISELTFKDELAFVLSHELTHLLEGHTDHSADNSESFKNWWSSQSHEVVADHVGVDRMVGKFELDAALSVMEKLHPKQSEKVTARDIVNAGAGTHHAEGVRISAIQGYIDFLRRTNQQATPKAQIPISKEYKVAAVGRELSRQQSVNQTAVDNYFNWLQGHILGQGDFSVLKYEDDLYARISQAKQNPFENLLGENKTENYSELLKQTVTTIDKSSLSKIEKMNLFFNSMILLGIQTGDRMRADGWLSSFNSLDQFRLTEFMVKNMSGDNGWTVNDYKKLILAHPVVCRTFTETPFTQSVEGLNILKAISKVSKNWNQVLDYWTSFEAFLRPDGLATKEFLHTVLSLHGDDLTDSHFKKTYLKKVIDELNHFENIELLISKNDDANLPEFRILDRWVFNQFDGSNVQPELRLNPNGRLYLALKQRIFSKTITILNNDNQTSEQGRALTEVVDTLLRMNLSANQISELGQAYQKKIALALNPPPFDAEKATRQRFKRLSLTEIEMTARLIGQNFTDRKLVLDYIRYILLSKGAHDGIDLTKLSDFSNQIFRQIFSSLTKAELSYLSQTMTPVEQQVVSEGKSIANKIKATTVVEVTHNAFKYLPIPEAMKAITYFRNADSYLALNFDVNRNLLYMIFVFDRDKLAVSRLTSADLNQLLSTFEMSKRVAKFSTSGAMDSISQGAAKNLFYIFDQNKLAYQDLEKFVHTYERIMTLAGSTFSPPQEQEISIQNFLKAKLEAMSLADQARWLKRESVRKSLGAEFVGKVLALSVQKSAGTDRVRLKKAADKMLKEIPLREKWPDAYQVFRNQFVESANIQPHELKSVLSEDTRSVTQKIDIAGNLIRGMSTFSTFTRSLTYDQQIEMIEFIMARTEQIPSSVTNLDMGAFEGKVDLKQLFLKMREELKYRTALERTMVVNSILTGPNAMIATDKGLAQIHDHLLQSVSSQNREFASVMLNALAKAEGRNKSLILSYALAQKIEVGVGGKASLTEAVVLRSLLDYYGVPTVKLAQYLAFTSEFKDFQSALEVYQDAAMPITHYDALLLINKRLGSTWDPSLYKVNRIIGSGSVNIAIEYTNLKTGKDEVLSIARDEIEVKTKEDFRRFNLLVTELTSTPELKKRFNFVVGLMKIIEKSVTLEFNKQNSFDVQKAVQKLYNQTVDGWKIRTVDAYSIEGMAIFMEKAQGVGARKVLKEDQPMYESAMRAFMRVEYAALRGVDQTNNWNPMSLFANPDLHDGQIMIDAKTKTVTVLDFGQALKISNQEREFALDILRIISKVDSVDSSFKLLQKYATAMQGKKLNLSQAELAETLKRGDRMDVFVHLISVVNQAGFEIPLSTVHWVLAANRIIKLGEKVNMSPESSIKWMLAMRKAGVPLAGFNAAKNISENPGSILSKLKGPTKAVSVRCEGLFN